MNLQPGEIFEHDDLSAVVKRQLRATYRKRVKAEKGVISVPDDSEHSYSFAFRVDNQSTEEEVHVSLHSPIALPCNLGRECSMIHVQCKIVLTGEGDQKKIQQFAFIEETEPDPDLRS